MIRFYLTLSAVIIMAALIPSAEDMAVSQNSPLTSHLCYMFGHANILHWAINSWALLVLHNLFRPSRLIAAYILAFAISFLPHFSFVIYHLSFSPTGASVIGASVITCFFFGFLAPHLWHKDKLSACMMVALIVIAFFIPGIAAVPHLLMFLAGLAWYYIEYIIRSFRHFCK